MLGRMGWLSGNRNLGHHLENILGVDRLGLLSSPATVQPHQGASASLVNNDATADSRAIRIRLKQLTNPPRALFGSNGKTGGGGGGGKRGGHAMGNASSMLTQYDIEEVQEHCNYLCE
jgi:hypothetical protein